MDGDLGTFLQSMLSDPEQMAKITQMAQGLMGGAGDGSAGGTEAAPDAPTTQAAATSGDARILSMLTKALAPNAGKSRSTALLVAMRPYMRPEKQEKLDRAMKIARMVHVARAVMGEYGGSHGV